MSTGGSCKRVSSFAQAHQLRSGRPAQSRAALHKHTAQSRAARPIGPDDGDVSFGFAGAFTGVSGGRPSRSTANTFLSWFSPFLILPR